MFDYEISLIRNDEIKDLVIEALNNSPKSTWSRYASSTLKYHPLNDEGGFETVYQHTEKVVAMVLLLLNNEVFTGDYIPTNENNISNDDRDLLIAAAILHDSVKYGFDPDNERFTKFEHPVLVQKLLPSDNGGYWDKITRIVASHSGAWNTSKYSKVVLPLPESRLDVLLHQADWLVSRKNIKFYHKNSSRNLISRLKESLLGWWNDRKISKNLCKVSK